MEQHINKLWENQFLKLNQGQKQMEDMTRWIMMGGLSGLEELSDAFGKFWDMDFWSTETHDYMKAWNTTAEDLRKLFKDYLDIIGLVPKDDYLTLLHKYQDMNETVNDQTEEISKQVKMIADQKKIITEQKKEINKQKKIVSAKKEEIADQKKQVADLKKEIIGQKKEILKQKKIVAEQRKEIANRKKIVADLKKEVAVQIKSIKQLQMQTSR